MSHSLASIFPNRRLLNTLCLLVGLALFSVVPSVRADSLLFNTLPSSGAVSGTAGSTVGWGYSITNQSSSNWLLTTNLSSDTFVDGTPSLIFDFPSLRPRQTLTEFFSASTGDGLYKFVWDGTAPAGVINSGNFILSAEWWSGDPTSGGTFVADAPDAAIPYSAKVSASPVPEPATWTMLLVGASVAIARKRKAVITNSRHLH